MPVSFWGTGWAMVLLAGVLALRLPSKLIGILGLALMAGHSFLAAAVDSTWWGTLILRSDELLPSPGWHFYVSYPVLPWFGVMAFGYGAGGFIQKAGFNRPMRRALLWSGIGMTLLFVLLRIPNLLDPDPGPYKLVPVSRFCPSSIPRNIRLRSCSC